MQYNLLQHGEFLLLIVVLPFPMMVNGLKWILEIASQCNLSQMSKKCCSDTRYSFIAYTHHLLLRFSNAILTLFTLFRSLSFLLWSWSRLVASSIACWSNWSSIIAVLFAWKYNNIIIFGTFSRKFLIKIRFKLNLSKNLINRIHNDFDLRVSESMQLLQCSMIPSFSLLKSYKTKHSPFNKAYYLSYEVLFEVSSYCNQVGGFLMAPAENERP